jgi:hypothetical protein
MAATVGASIATPGRPPTTILTEKINQQQLKITTTIEDEP